MRAQIAPVPEQRRLSPGWEARKLVVSLVVVTEIIGQLAAHDQLLEKSGLLRGRTAYVQRRAQRGQLAEVQPGGKA